MEPKVILGRGLASKSRSSCYRKTGFNCQPLKLPAVSQAFCSRWLPVRKRRREELPDLLVMPSPVLSEKIHSLKFYKAIVFKLIKLLEPLKSHTSSDGAALFGAGVGAQPSFYLVPKPGPSFNQSLNPKEHSCPKAPSYYM